MNLAAKSLHCALFRFQVEKKAPQLMRRLLSFDMPVLPLFYEAQVLNITALLNLHDVGSGPQFIPQDYLLVG